MNRRTMIAAMMFALAAPLAGCGPMWRPIIQARPNPLYLQGKFAVLPVDYTGLHVGEKTEAEYLSGKSDTQGASFAEDKRALADEFAASLMARASEEGLTVVLGTGPNAAPFQVRPRIQSIEPGFYVGVASGASAVVMDLMITAPDGRLIDHVEITHRSSDYSTGGRLRKDGKGLGAIAARYLAVRVAGQE